MWFGVVLVGWFVDVSGYFVMVGCYLLFYVLLVLVISWSVVVGF